MSKIRPNFVNARIDNIPEINLRGDIDDYDGEWIASKIKNASDNNYKPAEKIRININSFGGSVNSGLTIITAMQLFKNAGGVIETVNEGCADSTAGWIFAAGTKGERKIMQFGSVYTHPPMLADGRTIEDLPQGSPERQAIDEAFKKIVDIFVPITGQSDFTIREMMLKETDMSADEAISNGFADSKIEVSNAPVLKNSLTRPEIVNITSGLILERKENSLINKFNKMGKVADLLNLNKEASEEAIFAEVQKVVNAKEKAENDLQNKQVELDQVNAELATAKEDLANIKYKAITAYVEELIVNDASNADQKDNLILMAKAVGLENFKKTNPVKVATGASIDEGIEEEGQEVADVELKNAKEFKSMTFAAREELKNSDPAKYETLVNAYDLNMTKLI